MGMREYTISELADEFDVTTRTIRFYEEKGLVTPRREGQRRLYSPGDRVKIKLILRGKRIGLSLAECLEIIDMYDPAHNNEDQLRTLLMRVEAREQELLKRRADLDAMLDNLDEIRALCQRALDSQATPDSGKTSPQNIH
jgi:DNA-binding transcriptional MerR regulator